MNPSATYKVFDGEVHILDYKTANIHSLNSTASFIWKQLIKPTSEKDNIMKIGSYNTFGIKSYILNSHIGDGNVVEARA